VSVDVALVASVVTFGCTASAAVLAARRPRRGDSFARARRALLGASLVCSAVAVSNVLEHAGITEALDPLEDGLEIIFLLGFFFFIHAFEAERALAKVREQSAWQRATFSAIGAGVLTTDAGGRVRTANPEMGRLLGRDEADLILRSIEDVLSIVPADERGAPLANPVVRALESGEGIAVPQGACLAKEGRDRIPVSGTVSPMLDGDGLVRGAVAVLRDETESTRLKEQLLHARKMDALGQLAGGIAHDFNNMLGGILGAADLLAEDVVPKSKAARYVEIIIQAAENAADLTAKLLAFGRKARLEFTELDVRELVLGTVALAERSMTSGVHIALEIAPESLFIVGDQAQLKSALLNLLLNARDALDCEGLISVTVRLEHLDREWCETSPFAIEAGPYVMISVRDTGTGMTQAVQSRIFEPFFTTKPEGKGTGLGLAAVFGAVESHHGAVTVYSEVGRGTVFHVYLPLAEGHGEAVVREEAPARVCEGGVLVVDDEAVVRATVELMLATSGFTLFAASNGARAVELFEAHKDAIDVVLMDVVMPDANGFEIAGRLRAIRPDVAIVFASGFVREVPRDVKVTHFIDKPFRRARLVEVLCDAVASAKSPPLT
jgi:two-component system cell cycle sensor histidine kinase/response regulator CckA